ncbi:hypothetical protein JVU11DRAFT_8789 [Chiua virens]|nr:hypothetical protein JVU11DRAFT_8789 [Chiua virens]
MWLLTATSTITIATHPVTVLLFMTPYIFFPRVKLMLWVSKSKSSIRSLSKPTPEMFLMKCKVKEERVWMNV